MFDYGRDVLAPRPRRERREVELVRGLVLEDRASGRAGAFVGLEAGCLVLEDRHGRRRLYRNDPGAFAVDGEPVTLVPPRAPSSAPGATASGSLPGPAVPARVARAGRIWVEGLNDAELLERVWGDDLRAEGIVVEPLHGIDGLADAVRAFDPRPDRRLGVLVDHLVPGSKEARIASTVSSPHALVTGHPYVDVWAAVRPRTLGLSAWPAVPPGTDYKQGVCAALDVATPADLWRRILASVRTYTDLEPSLVGAVERLLDFVTGAPA